MTEVVETKELDTLARAAHGDLTEIPYDKIRVDYDFGCHRPEFVIDFICDEEMVQNLNDCVIHQGVHNGMNVLDFETEKATVFVPETGHVWILSSNGKRMMLRRYTDATDTLRVYDCDIEKVKSFEVPNVADLAAWWNVKCTTLRHKASTDKWAGERRLRRKDKADSEREVMQLKAEEVYRQTAERTIEILKEVIEKGFENVQSGEGVTNRDMLQGAATLNTITRQLADMDNKAGGNTYSWVQNLVQTGMVKPVEEAAEVPEVVDAEFEVIQEEIEG